MVALNSKFDILRGWPNSSAVSEDFVIGGTTSHPHLQGQWVSLANKSDGSMETVDDLGNTTSAAALSCYLVIEGLDDHSAKFANRVTCLLGGGYIVRIAETAPNAFGGGTSYRCFKSGTTASSFTAGKFAKVDGGLLDAEAARTATTVGQIIAVDVNNGTVDLLVF